MEETQDDREAMRLADYLEDYIAALKRRWWLLILVPLVLAGTVYWFATRQPVTYTASATVLVTQPSTQGSGLSSDVWSGTLLTQTYAPLVTSPPVLERVIADLGLDWTVPELAEHVNATAQVETQLVEIRGTASDPDLAADITNATGEAFVTWLAEFQTATSSASTESLQTSINQARTDIEETSTELASLRAAPNSNEPAIRAQISNLEATLTLQQETYTQLLQLQPMLELEQLAIQNQARLISQAAPPGPDGSLGSVYTAIALVFGLGLAAIMIVLFERISWRVRTPRDVQRVIDQPVLAALPRTPNRSTVDLLARPESQLSEAVRSLSARLRFGVNGQGLGTIVLASAERNRPSPALAANLAIALAQSGERVVLVDGNLRHPRLHALFGAPANAPGLANLLERSSARVNDLLVEGPHPGLRLLLAGTSTKTAGELLAGDQLIQVVAELRRSADVVIMDVPPLVGSTVDALLFTAAADHAILVVDAGRTRPVDLETALAELGTTGVDVFGVVLAGAEPRYRR